MHSDSALHWTGQLYPFAPGTGAGVKDISRAPAAPFAPRCSTARQGCRSRARAHAAHGTRFGPPSDTGAAKHAGTPGRICRWPVNSQAVVSAKHLTVAAVRGQSGRRGRPHSTAAVCARAGQGAAATRGAHGWPAGLVDAVGDAAADAAVRGS